MTPKIDPMASADVNSQLEHTVADRFAIAEISRFNSAQAQSDTRFSGLVAHAGEPFRYWLAAIFALVTQELHQA